MTVVKVCMRLVGRGGESRASEEEEDSGGLGGDEHFESLSWVVCEFVSLYFEDVVAWKKIVEQAVC